MGGRLFVLTCLVVLGTAVTVWANPFTEVPAGEWAYGTCARLVTVGILPVDRATGFTGTPALTRFEFATAILQPLSEIDRALQTLPEKPDPRSIRERVADALNIDPRLSELDIARAASDLVKLGQEFDPELVALGFTSEAALRALQLLSDPTAVREWRLEALSRTPLTLPALTPNATSDALRVPIGHGSVALDYERSTQAPQILDYLARSMPVDLATLGARGLGTVTPSPTDPSISRLRTAYEYGLGSSLTLRLGWEEIARRGIDLLPLDDARLRSLGIGYRFTPSTSVKVSYSLLDYQSYVSNTPPVRERVAETAVSIEF